MTSVTKLKRKMTDRVIDLLVKDSALYKLQEANRDRFEELLYSMPDALLLSYIPENERHLFR